MYNRETFCIIVGPVWVIFIFFLFPLLLHWFSFIGPMPPVISTESLVGCTYILLPISLNLIHPNDTLSNRVDSSLDHVFWTLGIAWENDVLSVSVQPSVSDPSPPNGKKSKYSLDLSSESMVIPSSIVSIPKLSGPSRYLKSYRYPCH